MTTYAELSQEIAILETALSPKKHTTMFSAFISEMIKLTKTEHTGRWREMDAEVPEEVANQWRKAYADAVKAHTPPEMRQPTSEEMIAGIEQAARDQLSLLCYGRVDLRPVNLMATALANAADTQIKAWLDANTNKLVNAIAESVQVDTKSLKG
jgi:hypothetical protein